LAATLTAWSECVPEPNMKKAIITLPNLRSPMKKLVLLRTFFMAQRPMAVMPTR